MTSENQPRTPLAQLQERGLNHSQRLQTIARRHVGGAALEQTAAVEGIIAAGREQIEIADALREVMSLTLHEVRAASLEQIQTAAPKHVTMLREIIQAGRDQLDVAALLQETINQALERRVKRFIPVRLASAAGPPSSATGRNFVQGKTCPAW